VKFGLQPTEGGAFFDEAIAELRLAEEVGFDSVWLSEHHGVRNHYWPSPLLALGAFAKQTARVALGTNVIVLPFYHPRRVVEDAAMLQLLAGGRIILGVGMGYREDEYAGFGVPTSERGRRYEEGLAAIRYLLSDARSERSERTGFAGRYFPMGAVQVEPAAVVPVWAGGWGTHNLRRAAQYADAWIPGPVADLDQLLHCRAQYYDFLRALGRDPSTRPQPLTRELIVAPTESQALDAAEKYLLPIYRDEYGGGWKHSLVGARDAGNLSEIGQQRFIVGSPDRVIEGIRFFADRFGCDQMIFRLYGPHTPHDFIMKEIALLGREVLPAFAKTKTL